MKKTLIGSAIALAQCLAPCSAAEWTQVVDLPVPATESTLLQGQFAATAEALWIDDQHALDPNSGETLSALALPERLIASSLGPGMRSSRRGQLWQLDRRDRRFVADARGNFWSTEALGPGGDLDSAQVIAVDGAQQRERGEFGAQWEGYSIRTVIPRDDAAGAYLLLAAGAESGVVQVDDRLAVTAQFEVPACTTDVRSDRHGGIYAICYRPPTDQPLDGQVQHVTVDPQQSWPEPRAIEALQHFEVAPNGSLLVAGGRSDELVWRLIARDGIETARFGARIVATFAEGLWAWSGEDGRLHRRDFSGASQASVTMAMPYELTAHASGAVLAFDPSPGSSAYGRNRLFSPSAQLIRTIERWQAPSGLTTAIRFGDDALWAVASNDPQAGYLLDEDGALASGNFSIAVNFDERIRRVLAGEIAVCVQRDAFRFLSGIRRAVNIRCTARDGRLLGSIELDDSSDLLAVGNLLYVRSGAELRVYTPNGSLQSSLSLQAEQAHAVNPRHGIAIARVNGAGVELAHYGPSGELRFSRVAGPTARVFVTDDGSVFSLADHGLLSRYSANGSLLGTTQLGTAPIAALDANANAVVVVSTHYPLQSPRTPTRVSVLSPDLGEVRATYDIAATPSVEASLAFGIDTGAWAAVRNEAGIQRLQFDLASGQLRARSIFPITPIPSSLGASYRHADVLANGKLRFLDYDSQHARFVLRIADAVPRPFTGPVRQQAFAGSWYAPSATGQGLIVNLLNDASQLFAAWHTYAPEGGNSLAKQQWLTVQGDVGNQRGAITLPIYRNRDGRFDVVGRTDAEAVGEAELVFTGCDRMEFWYRLGDERGALPLQRLTPRTLPCDNGTRIEAAADAPSGIDVSGPWYDPSRSGQGLAVSASGARFNQFLAGWFSYDADGANDDPDAQHWFTVQGPNPARYGEAVIATIYRTIGGSRSGQPTRNTHKVGSAELTVHDCGHATLEYVFDDSALAGAFANKSRALPLTRLGRCPD
jgi:hypothetical protein